MCKSCALVYITIQEDVEADSSSTDITPPIDTPSDTTSTGGNDSGGNTTPFYAIDLYTDYQSLQTVGNSIATPSNTADPSGLILYRS